MHLNLIVRGLYQTVPEYGAPANIRRSFSEGQHYIEYRVVDSTGRTDICSFIVVVRGDKISFNGGSVTHQTCVSAAAVMISMKYSAAHAN